MRSSRPTAATRPRSMSRGSRPIRARRKRSRSIRSSTARVWKPRRSRKLSPAKRTAGFSRSIGAGSSRRRRRARREQAHLIYDWVSKHIRYVAIFLGNGGYEPHDAATILENGYGDCKDHVVLLESLLAAKGIASLPVLIDSGNRYRATEAATPAAFNHVLTYLPEFAIYADSTIGVAPFGALAAAEYGKPIATAGEGQAGLGVV